MSNASRSPRRRRLRRTARILCGAAVIGSGLWLASCWWSKPPPYRPDERPDEITSALSSTVPADAPPPRFAEVSTEAGLRAFRNFEGQRTSQIPEDMGPGMAWGDYDNDGDDDLFLVSAGGALDLGESRLLPSRLFENLGDGSFRPCSGFPELRIRGMGAAWGDFDGDGFLDLAVSGYDTLRLFHNEGGRGVFLADGRLPNLPGFWAGLAWGDFDHDRRLDLYVCNYLVYAPDDALRDLISDQLGTVVPHTLNPASYPPGRNALFRQEVDGSFTNVAAALGVENSEGRSLGALWHDFDLDGNLDLYVANDVSDNVLYRNLGGRFQDLSHAAHVADYRSAMGLAAADFDRDGDDDLFISHWVAQENGFYENLWADFNSRRPGRTQEDGRGAVRRSEPREADSIATAGAETGVLHAGEPTSEAKFPLQFIDIADRVGLGQISLDRVGWGAEFADFDHDGWLDLVVANGSTLEEDGPRPKRLRAEAPFLFWSRRGKTFHDLVPALPILRQEAVSRGLACADWDGDGDLDFAVADLGGGVRLFRNDMAAGHSLQVRLRSRNAVGEPNGFGHGTTAVAWVDGVPLRRSVNSVSYLSQSSLTLHWGLGGVSRVDRLEVHWLAGKVETFSGLEAGGFYEAREGDSEIRRLPRSDMAAAAPPRTVGPRMGPVDATVGTDARARTLQFWNLHRAGMDALKSDQDLTKAVQSFRGAIALNPKHQDSRYYLAQALASLGETEAALQELTTLQGIAPDSHRAWQQWGVLRARTTSAPRLLASAEQALQRAVRLNPEETGAVLALATVALLRGNDEVARQHLVAVARTNPRSTGASFLLGYLAWRQGENDQARQWLVVTRESLGPDWQPKGATSEGDVRRKQHTESLPLDSYWQEWNGSPDPEEAFRHLDQRLSGLRVRGTAEGASPLTPK